jgi:NADPH:quinone reductase-like Zn-dependent oxidoreductase
VRDRGRVVSIVDAGTVKANGGKYVFVRPNGEQLGWLADLANAGQLRVEVQQTFPLADAGHAQSVLEGGHVRGKLVLTVVE